MERFKIEKKLGRGPVGASYAATLVDSGLPVVAKVVTSKFHDHPQLLEAMVEDVRSWVGFQHANLVLTRGVGEHQGRKLILFDHAPGQTVESWLREKGSLEPRTAMMVLRDLTMAVSLGHAGDLAFGDLRAAKVYFDGQRARIADPGLWRGACMAQGFGQYGMTFGHPAYLAPEVLQEGVNLPSKAADVYALGVLFHELLTGRLPFLGDPKEQLRAHLETPFPTPPPVRQSPAVEALLRKLTAKQPQHRFRDAQAVLEALYEMVGQKPPPQEAFSPLSTQTWRRQAVQQAVAIPTREWSPEKVKEARPVGPDLLASQRGAASGRLPRQTSEFNTGSWAAALKAAGGAAGGEQTMEVATGTWGTQGSAPASSPTPAPAGARATRTSSQQREAVGGAQPPPDAVRLGNELGRGPIGSVYEGQLASYSGQLAIKVISSKFEKHPELHQRILATASKAAGLGGATVVPVFRVMKVGGRDLVLADKVEGRTLRAELTQRGRLTPEEALSRARDIALALAAGERRKLSHGDIRPEKVWVTSKGRARVADFGLAEAACLGAGYGQLGMPFGHPVYLAPEVLQEAQKEPTFAADVYALGVMLYELLSGKPPYKGDSDKKTLMMHLDPLPPPPKQVRVPAALAELIMRLAAKDPRRRPATGKDLLVEIERCQKQVALAGSGESQPAIDEFDPTGTAVKLPPVKLPPWAKENAKEAMEKSDSWSREKLEQVKPTGPKDWPLDDLWQSEEIGEEG